MNLVTKRAWTAEFKGVVLPLLIVCCCILTGDASTFNNENSLRRELFVNYSSDIRPVINQSDTVYINVNFTIYSIQALEAKDQLLKASVSLGMMWRNELLTWRPEEYGGLESILVRPSEVWIPDITVYNGANGHTFLGGEEFLIRLYSDGNMMWFPGDVIETQCPIAIARYPFDTQTCEIQYSMWMHPSSTVQLLSSAETADLTLFSENGEWDLLSNKVENTTIMFETLYSFFKCKLVLKRRVAYHLINTVLPVLLLSILNVLVFVLPPEAGEKMSLAITVLLAYAVFLSIINENMPAISTSVSVLAVYVVIILGLGTASTFLSAIVLHYAYNDEGRHRRFFSLDCIRAYTISRKSSAPSTKANGLFTVSKPSDQANGSEKKETKPNIQPRRKLSTRASSMRELFAPIIEQSARDLVDLIDVISFWIFLTITVLVFLVIILILTVGDI